MAQSKQALKGRIRSIRATKKITSAMKLVATSKLQRQKNLMEKNKEYATYLKDMVARILSDNEGIDNQYLKKVEDTNPLTILFTSDLGLCGGYNSNELRYLQEIGVKKDQPIMVIGSKGLPWLTNRGYKVINEYINSDSLDFLELSKIANQVLAMFIDKEITSIRIVFTKFVNSVTFEPTAITLLPVSKESMKSTSANNLHQETIFEPDASSILNDLIPMYIRSLAYSYWLETKTAEQASRRMAMENATDNAEELIDTLVLQYNQARQAAITQEITEIVSGADAL